MIDTCRGEIEWKWETDWDLSDRKMGTDGCRKMKEDDGVRTLECLRGRLLAERQASRVAKEAAELLSNKVTELEKHLKKEARLRDKAEKRLKLLMKKIESLKLSPVLEESEHLTSSDYSASSSSCGSTTTTNLAQPDPEESESKPQQTDKPSSIHQESKIKDKCPEEEEDDDESVDNSMALVPVTSLLETHKKEPNADVTIVSRSVGEVLDTLRKVRERIEGSMGRSG